jgi:hypothetical protein
MQPSKAKHRIKRDRLTPRSRSLPGRVFRVHPDPSLPFVVEVRVARTRRHMREEMRRVDNATGDDLDPRCMGQVRRWMSKITGCLCYRPRGIVARMYLNVRDLRDKPSEIVSHECAHAGMTWARLRGANLSRMDGEEVLCYAVGHLVRQVNSACFAHGVWKP